jgi:ABC-type branched-subunit amino acid transport system substrate-binding protein
MHSTIRTTLARRLGALALCAFASGAQAQKSYDPGATDTEIKIGNLVPYSGPASSYGTIGKAAGAYFDKINAEGGIKGRKIRFLSLDDGYNPAKTVEQTRKLVEQEEVLLLFASLGTAQNASIQRYMNAKKVPQLFLISGANRWDDPRNFPWTMGWLPSYRTEGQVYAQHIRATNPDAKIAILSQNDDYGRDNLKGFLDGLGELAKTMVVAQATYEVTDPSIDGQIVTLKSSGANVFVNFSTPKFAAQAIRKTTEIGWKPTQYLSSVSNSVTAVLKPAGFEKAVGIISSTYFRDPTDARWKNTPEYAEYAAWLKKYYPTGDEADSLNVIGYSLAQTLVQVLKQAGDNLTRANVMKEAANLSMTLPMLIPGIDIKTAPDDFSPISRIQLIKFNGASYEPLGRVIGR